MTKIDFTGKLTREDREEAAWALRVEEMKQECESRILSVINRDAQANVMAMLQLERLTSEQAAVVKATFDWITAMVTERKLASIDKREPVWPEVPAGSVELGRLL